MKILGVAALAALMPTVSVAFEFTGGNVELSYSLLTEDSDLDRLDLGGSLEFGITRNFAVQADLAFTEFGASGLSLTSFGLHGIYHASESTSVGLFLGQEQAESGGTSANENFIGVEVGYEVQAFDIEAYYAKADSDLTDGSVAGASGSYAINDAFSVGLALDRLDADATSVTALTLRGGYAVTPATQLFAEVGNASIDGAAAGSVDSAFISLGATVNFGAERGATFERRSLLGTIPGF
ncbi:MAG: porin [Paracoccaceae bacterium]